MVLGPLNSAHRAKFETNNMSQQYKIVDFEAKFLFVNGLTECVGKQNIAKHVLYKP